MGLAVWAGLLALITAAGCERKPTDLIQGYVEGEYVYVAAPQAGTLETLAVARGNQVKAGDPLFTMDRRPQQATRDAAARRLSQAQANLEDLQKGRRPTEIAALEAQLKGAQAALVYSETELARVKKLFGTEAIGPQDVDKALAARDQDAQRVAQIQADLSTAKLGARSDQIAAAEATVRGVEADLAKADWDLNQQKQNAPADALVFDTLYRPGEWVAAGKPVAALLPPGNIKVRAFVPEPKVAAVRMGQAASVKADGMSRELTGKVSYLSPQAEYTPPVIYSQETRGKLVFMIEILFDPAAAAQLHPGQPVDVKLGK